MKKILSVIMAVAMLMTMLVLPSYADEVVVDDYYEEWVDPYEGLKIKSLTVKATKDLIVNVHCGDSGYYDENDEWVSDGIVYDLSASEPYVTVVYENGKVEEGYAEDLYGALDLGFTSEDTDLEIGKHQVEAFYRDAKTTFEVEVVENPVKSVKVVAQKKLVEGWDSYNWVDTDEDGNEVERKDYYLYAAEPVFTITMKDGSVVKGTDEEIFNQTGFWTFDVYDQYEKPLKVGKNTVQFEYLGVKGDCVIEIIANPYKSVSLKGENDVYLVFEGIDKKDSYESKIVEFHAYDWYMDGHNAWLKTEDGKEYDVFVYSDADEDGVPSLSKNVSMEIGGFTTNTLENCNFFKISWEKEAYVYAAWLYYETSEELTGEQFDGYSADEEADINDLVALSTYIAADYDKIEYKDDKGVYKLTVDESEGYIEEVFGIADADVKKSDFYGFLRGVQVDELWNTDWGYTEPEVYFADGMWTINSIFYDWETEEIIGTLNINLNEDGTVENIYLVDLEIEAGDVNCDGSVTAVDARLVLQDVAGLLEEGEINTFYADVNGDGNITAVDARLILQKVAGLIE